MTDPRISARRSHPGARLVGGKAVTRGALGWRGSLVLLMGLLACCLKTGPDPECGNGIVEGDEECDCASGASPPPGCEGNNGDFSGAPCRTDCSRPFCGDGILDDGESCDGTSLGGESCASQGFSGGDLLCDPHCALDSSGCFSQSAPAPGGGSQGG